MPALRNAVVAGPLLMLLALGLTATRRAPLPTPAAGFYRLELTAPDAPMRVRLVCFAPGHGNVFFGERTTERGTMSCGQATVGAVGDGWQSRQRCVVEGRIVDLNTTGLRSPDGSWRVRSTARPLAARNGAPVVDDVVLRRVTAACPPRWRRGDYLELAPHTAGEPYVVTQMRARAEGGTVRYQALPPALARLAP